MRGFRLIPSEPLSKVLTGLLSGWHHVIDPKANHNTSAAPWLQPQVPPPPAAPPPPPQSATGQAQADALRLAYTEQQLVDARQRLAEMEELLRDLPEIFERKFQQRLQPLVERHDRLLEDNQQLRQQMRQLTATPAEMRQLPPAGQTTEAVAPGPSSATAAPTDTVPLQHNETDPTPPSRTPSESSAPAPTDIVSPEPQAATQPPLAVGPIPVASQPAPGLSSSHLLLPSLPAKPLKRWSFLGNGSNRAA